MDKFSIPIQIRWADLDPNSHLRHSVYYDYGATVRVSCFAKLGLTTAKLTEFAIGPILFREEAIFKREIIFEDQIVMGAEVTRARRDFARWSLRHHIYKSDGTLCTILNMDIGWLDLNKRKLAIPNEYVHRVIDQFPKSADFQWTEKKPAS